MKKLVLMFVAMVAMTFAACENKAASTVVENDTTLVADSLVDTTAVDSVPADTIVK